MTTSLLRTSLGKTIFLVRSCNVHEIILSDCPKRVSMRWNIRIFTPGKQPSARGTRMTSHRPKPRRDTPGTALCMCTRRPVSKTPTITDCFVTTHGFDVPQDRSGGDSCYTCHAPPVSSPDLENMFQRPCFQYPPSPQAISSSMFEPTETNCPQLSPITHVPTRSSAVLEVDESISRGSDTGLSPEHTSTPSNVVKLTRALQGGFSNGKRPIRRRPLSVALVATRWGISPADALELCNNVESRQGDLSEKETIDMTSQIVTNSPTSMTTQITTSPPREAHVNKSVAPATYMDAVPGTRPNCKSTEPTQCNRHKKEDNTVHTISFGEKGAIQNLELLHNTAACTALSSKNTDSQKLSSLHPSSFHRMHDKSAAHSSWWVHSSRRKHSIQRIAHRWRCTEADAAEMCRNFEAQQSFPSGTVYSQV